jgi:hypothetical protein
MPHGQNRVRHQQKHQAEERRHAREAMTKVHRRVKAAHCSKAGTRRMREPLHASAGNHGSRSAQADTFTGEDPQMLWILHRD